MKPARWHDGSVLHENGHTAVVVPVPAAEPVVSKWREQFDDSTAQGMPAHITALYPFLPAERVSREVVAELRALCAGVSAVDVMFQRTGRFPGVLYLDPEPAGELQDLTAAIAARWLDAPPYAGAFDGVVPHLTVAYSGADGLDEIETDVQRHLPFTAHLDGACLYVFDGERWHVRAHLPFACGTRATRGFAVRGRR